MNDRFWFFEIATIFFLISFSNITIEFLFAVKHLYVLKESIERCSGIFMQFS